MSQRATIELEALLTPNEVCATLRISRATFYRLIGRGDLRAVKLGSRDGASIRIRAAELARFLSEDRPAPRGVAGAEREAGEAAGRELSSPPRPAASSPDPKEAP